MTAPARKKVLFTSHVANFQKFNRPFMRMLSEQGYEIHYASDGEEKILDCDKEFTIPFRRSPFSFSNIKAIFKLKKIIDHENYDIIHTHTPMGSVVTRLAAVAARKKGTRVIYTAHGFHFFKGAPIANWLIYYPIEMAMAHFTDTLITINKEDYERAKGHFKIDVQYVPGVGVDSGKFSPGLTNKERNTLRASMGLKSNDFVIIYPAELSKRKRQIWLIKALSSLISLKSEIHILLPGSDSLSGAAQELARKRHIQNNVHFLGYRNDIPRLMMISDLSVSSSSQEGLPVNLLEALAAKLPIVASDSRGHEDLVIDGLNGFIVAMNQPDLFSECVFRIYSDRDLRAGMSGAGLDILQDYHLSKILRMMSEIYAA